MSKQFKHCHHGGNVALIYSLLYRQTFKCQINSRPDPFTDICPPQLNRQVCVHCDCIVSLGPDCPAFEIVSEYIYLLNIHLHILS